MMYLERELYRFTGFTFGWVVLVLLTFGILTWLHAPTGNFLDWVIGAISFWWLIVIVTVPWNIHFTAKAVLAEAATSQERGIAIDDRTCKYVTQVQNRALWVALGLHLASAIALYLLAVTKVSSIGYVSSVAALLLTGLRPAIAAYRYLMQQLANIGQDLKYPREDIIELRACVQQLTEQQKALAFQLDPKESSSWVARQQSSLDHLQQDLAKLSTAHEQLKAANDQAHERISNATRTAIAQLNEDSQFLNQARDIIRFFKEA